MLQSIGRLVLLVSAIGGLVACGSGAKPGEVDGSSASAKKPVEIPVAAETAARAGSQPNDAAIWLHPTDPSKSVILGANGEGGIEIYSLRGERLSAFAGVQADFIDIDPGFPLGSSGDQALVVAYDTGRAGVAAFTLDPISLALTPVSTRALQTGAEVTGLCTYHSPRTGRHYVFAATDDGFLQQWELLEKGGRVEGGLVRSLPMGPGAGYCAVDRRDAVIYVAEESVGIWKLSAEPESDPERELLDLVGQRGHLAEEVKGLAFVPSGTDGGYLLAADVGAGRINVYSTRSRKYVGSFALQVPPEAEALKETEGLVAITANLGAGLPSGLLVLADKPDRAPAASYRLISWQHIVSALKLDAAMSSSEAETVQYRNVMPSVETEPVDDYGDAADDPAIWVHLADPSKSLIIGAQKKRGLYVYDLSGKTLQVVPDGRMNNVDLRQGFRLGNDVVAIVAASNRTAQTLALYKVDAATRRLENIAAEPIPTGFDDPYGLCMYREAKAGTFYVFMNDADSGAYKQWKLVPKGNRVAAEVVREFTVGSQAEGCAADDETGALYVAEEDVGLWRYEADPSGGDRRVAIDSTSGQGHLTPDVEGVAIYYGENGTGYLIVSNQGKDNYAVYRREGNNEFLGHFSVIADSARGIDGASETDGLDVISTPLGPTFPYGLFVAQDGRNIAPAERQNFKLVPWERVADVMSLQKFTGWRPEVTR